METQDQVHVHGPGDVRIDQVPVPQARVGPAPRAHQVLDGLQEHALRSVEDRTSYGRQKTTLDAILSRNGRNLTKSLRPRRAFLDTGPTTSSGAP